MPKLHTWRSCSKKEPTTLSMLLASQTSRFGARFSVPESLDSNRSGSIFLVSVSSCQRLLHTWTSILEPIGVSCLSNGIELAIPNYV